VDVNKSHDDNKEGGQRERVFDKSQGDIAYSILNYELKIETCVPEKKVMNCSVAKKSVKGVCYSMKSRGKTPLEVSGGGENEEEETSVRKVEKRVREESENSKEIVKRKGVDVFLGIMPHLNGNTPL